MTQGVHQALICWCAAESLGRANPKLFAEYGVYDGDVHAVANSMDACTSFSSHKYIDHAQIDAFMGSRPGAGVSGFWSFRDGTKLAVSCAEIDVQGRWANRFTVIYPDGEGRLHLRDMRAWPENRSEPVAQTAPA